MEWCLEKNLATYDDRRLHGKVEVLCLNNASEDGSKKIIEDFVQRSPDIFRLVDRDNRGYGSSINEAMASARGKYFRIVDADDWVDTDHLVEQVTALENSDADAVITNYRTVNLQDGTMSDGGTAVHTNSFTESFDPLIEILPSIHQTTYRTELLRSSGFYMQDKIYFVDEEYVILPFLHVKKALLLDLDIYRYAVANPAQSTSPGNRAKYRSHREQVLKRLLKEYTCMDSSNPAFEYCTCRITKGIGDHFTTLLIYAADRKEGRKEAHEWEKYVKDTAPELLIKVKNKAKVLYLLNSLGVSLETYNRLKVRRKKSLKI